MSPFKMTLRFLSLTSVAKTGVSSMPITKAITLDPVQGRIISRVGSLSAIKKGGRKATQDTGLTVITLLQVKNLAFYASGGKPAHQPALRYQEDGGNRNGRENGRGGKVSPQVVLRIKVLLHSHRQRVAVHIP